MASKTVNFKVGMTCGGCSGAITKILSKIEGTKEVMSIVTVDDHFRSILANYCDESHFFIVGVTNVDANVETKSVIVTCQESVADSKLLEVLKKWSASSGKDVELVAA